jgi:hypothetical protein
MLLADLAAAAGVFVRPLAFVYALKGGKGLPQYADEQLLNYFDQVSPGITSMPAFFLNVDNPEQYENILNGLAARNITIIPAIGGPPTNEILTSTWSKGVARGYRKYTDHVRLETGAGYIEEHGIQSIKDMVDYCTNTLGFTSVMVNPWPVTNGSAVRFDNPAVDSSFNNVLYPSGDTDWYPGNQNRYADIKQANPNAQVLINYESPGQQQALVELEQNKKGASIAAMQITVDEINGQYKAEDLHWAPPLGKSYDAIALGTWDWIAATLSQSGKQT